MFAGCYGIMKKLIILPLLLTLLALSGCKKITEFYINDKVTFTIPANSFIIPLNVFSPQTRTTFESTIETNDSKVKWVKEAVLDRLELIVTSPSGEDFSFLKSVEVFLSAPNEPEILLAYQYEVSSTPGNRLTLISTGTSLREFLDEDYITLRTEAVTDETIPYNVDVVADYRIFVKAKASPF